VSSIPSDRRKWLHERLLTRDGPDCWYCGVLLDSSNRKRVPTIDHKIPECRGGDHELDNLVRACAECNLAKGEMTDEEYFGSHRLEKRIAEINHQPRFTHSRLAWNEDGSWECGCDASGASGESPTLIPCGMITADGELTEWLGDPLPGAAT
jgi:hypothetical protein